MWRALSGGRHKGVQTAMGPSQASSRSLETAHPVGCASALGRRFRDPKQIGWDAGDLPSRGGKLRASIPTWPLPPGPYDPHSVTPEVPQDPLIIATVYPEVYPSDMPPILARLEPSHVYIRPH
jgi:hypothetical protein